MPTTSLTHTAYTYANVRKYRNITVNNGTSNAMFVSKFNPEGKVLWNSLMLISNTIYNINLSTDVSNNLYVCGFFNRSTGANDQGLFVYNADGTLARNFAPLTSTTPGFLLRYDSGGSNNLGGLLTSSTGGVTASITGIGVTSTRNMYCAINHGGSNVQYNGNSILTGAQPGSAGVIFVNSAGTYQWLARMFCTNSGGASANYLVTDSTDAYVSCDFYAVTADPRLTISNSPTYGNGLTRTVNSVSSNTQDICLMRFNNSGNNVWASKMGGTGTDSTTGLAIDSSANVYITGNTSTAAISFFNNAEASIISYTAPTGLSSTYGFLAKYDGSTGSPIWAAYILDATISNVTCDTSNNVYISGTYTTSNTRLYNATTGRALFATLSNYTPLTTVGFLAKYDTNGVGQWAFRTLSSNASIAGWFHSTTSLGEIYAVGGFSSSVNILNADGTTLRSLTSTGGSDGFLARYNRDVSGAWVTTVGGSTNQGFSRVITDLTNNIITYGTYPTGTQMIISNT